MSFDTGSGGGYAGTNWNGYDVRQMWSMVENQQTDGHWKHVAGWRKTFELTSMHLYQLKEYREKLAQAWPPEKSPASQAYMERLDYLISHVQATYDAATANYDAFSGATGALRTTRYELKKIYDEYNANQTKLDDYDLQVAAAKDPVNSGLPQPSPGPPPVPPGRQEELNNKARVLMFGLSGELIQARSQLKQPPPYTPPKATKTPGETTRGNDGGGSGPPPPIIPPVVPVPALATPAPSAAPPAGGAPNSVPAPGSGGGPVLGGTGPGTGTLPPGTINPMPAPLPPGGGPTPPGGPLPPIIGPPIPPPSVPPKPIPGPGVIGPKPPPPKPAPHPGLPPKPMPPGGIIGTPVGPAGIQTRANQPVPRRVNPIGGVIGQKPGLTPGEGPAGARGVAAGGVTARGTGPAGAGRARGLGGAPGAGGRFAAGGSAAEPYGAMSGGHRGHRDAEEEHGRHWDPDNPWETDEGVAPVVLPPQEARRIDPGPAIGSDR